MSNLEDVLSKLVYSNEPQGGWPWGSGGKAPCRWAIFERFWKKSYFSPIGSHFAGVHTHLKELDF